MVPRGTGPGGATVSLQWGLQWATVSLQWGLQWATVVYPGLIDKTRQIDKIHDFRYFLMKIQEKIDKIHDFRYFLMILGFTVGSKSAPCRLRLWAKQ